MRIHLVVLLMAISLGSLAWSQTSQPAGEVLGTPYTSVAAGIAISPPLGSTLVKGAVGGTEVARFVDERKNWILKVSRVLLEPTKPLPLTAWKDEKGNIYPGMLELTADQFMNDVPGAKELRRDSTYIHETQVGMLAAKFDYGLETNLMQEAIFRASDFQYYIVAMTSPAPRTGDLEADPGVQKAAATFQSVLNSVQIVDQSQLQKDRDERLLRTRTLYLNLTEAKLKNTIRPGQWLRILRNGKDVGYTYVVEEIARDLPRKGQADQTAGSEGVLVGMRTRMMEDNGDRIDSESWLFCSFDRRYEAFSNTIYSDSPKTGKSIGGDIGFSRLRLRPVAVAPKIGEAKTEPMMTDEYKLEVNKLGRNTSTDPVVRDLPPYYLPQALGYMLPRLAAERSTRTYLFASWVPDAGQVVYRYVDVAGEQEANLNGRRIRAIAIQDRIGLEGAVTTHYVGDDGQYLGSINNDTRTTIVATDSATLERLWKDANLTRPGAVER